jgi:hypothetical protein
MEMEDGLGVGFFFKVLIVDGGVGRGLYSFTFFIFMFVIFWDLLLLKGGGGGVGFGAFLLKIRFLLLTFLIVCKFFVFFFSLSKAERGARV